MKFFQVNKHHRDWTFMIMYALFFWGATCRTLSLHQLSGKTSLTPVGLISVIVKKSSPKNLSAVCRPTVGRQSTDSRPTVYRQVKKKEKIVLKTNS